MNKPETLGKRIAQARRELGVRERRDVTQLDLAKAVGVSGPTVSDWEADKKSPREEALAKLAAYLGVTPAYLRYGVTDNPGAVLIGNLPIENVAPVPAHVVSEAVRIEAARAAREAAEAAAREADRPQRRRRNG